MADLLGVEKTTIIDDITYDADADVVVDEVPPIPVYIEAVVPALIVTSTQLQSRPCGPATTAVTPTVSIQGR